MSKNEKIISIVVTGLFALGSVFMLFYIALDPFGREFEGLTPTSFPKLIFYIILAMSLIDLVKEVITMRNDFASAEKGASIFPVPALVSICSIILYVFAWDYLGFTLSSAIYITVVSKYLRKQRPWWRCSLVGIGFSLLIYFLFVKVFGVRLPEPLLGLILY